MRAVIRDRYGKPDVLRIAEVPVPVPTADQVLIRVAAASLNAYDWHMLTGTPVMVRAVAGVRRPKAANLGADVAGTVVAVGAETAGLAVGDRVMGDLGAGAFAEYVATQPRRLVRIPDGVSFEDGAATPLAGLTALQALRDVGGLQPGMRVLVNGASGGVGTFAIQIAKALGAAQVTAVCSTAKMEKAAAIGADKVVDYTVDDYTVTERDYDLLLDNAGNRPWNETSRVLAPGGINVTITGPKHAVLGPFRNLLYRKLQSRFSSKRMTWFTAHVKQEDLASLAELLAGGAVRPVIEAAYPVEQAADALRYLGGGHAHGKLVITL